MPARVAQSVLTDLLLELCQSCVVIGITSSAICLVCNHLSSVFCCCVLTPQQELRFFRLLSSPCLCQGRVYSRDRVVAASLHSDGHHRIHYSVHVRGHGMLSASRYCASRLRQPRRLTVLGLLCCYVPCATVFLRTTS